MDPALLGALLVLTFATGLVDAASVLGLGRVFTANMTGNVVMLGFALGGRQEVSIAASLFAIGGFLVGAGVGGRLVRTDARRGLGRALALEVTLFGAATLVSMVVWDRASTQPVLLLLLGAGMGLQNAAVRRLAVADLTTTVLTLTLTGIAADLSLPGNATSRLARRGSGVFLMLAGATAGAALLSLGLAAPIGAAFLLVAAAAVVDRFGRPPAGLLGSAPVDQEAGTATS
jgi:uncharacterized membrane protein YoaK (UPF0700 family)